MSGITCVSCGKYGPFSTDWCEECCEAQTEAAAKGPQAWADWIVANVSPEKWADRFIEKIPSRMRPPRKAEWMPPPSPT